MIIRDKEWVDIASKLKEIHDKIKFLESKKRRLSTLLVRLSDNKNSCAEGYEYKYLVRSGSVDYSLIPELKDMDLSMYRKEDVGYWKLTFNEQFKEII